MRLHFLLPRCEGAVQVFIYGLHHSSKYWDAPEEFRPERWLSPAPAAGGDSSRPGAAPCPTACATKQATVL